MHGAGTIDSIEEKDKVLIYAAILIDGFELFKIILNSFKANDALNFLTNSLVNDLYSILVLSIIRKSLKDSTLTFIVFIISIKSITSCIFGIFFNFINNLTLSAKTCSINKIINLTANRNIGINGITGGTRNV